ncbi:MAG TPA: nicotinate-nucleotide adenylyltransferase [Hyphomonadaceae bacterium]|nr:nicotinate-nucleotide adenylyltransferase [Hyphomonadaceae bacterium]
MHRRRPSPHLRLPSLAGGLAIGIIGGSFDPPHAGHAHVIATARRALGLDRVWVFVAAGNPLKKTQTAFVDRYAAAHRRLAGPRTIVSPLEADYDLRYTIDLLRRLKRAAPQARFVWIMGGDNLRDFHKWKRWKEIAKLVPIAVVSRPGAMPKAGLSRFARMFGGQRLDPRAAETLKWRTPPAWVYIAAPLDPTSSTELRAQMMVAAIPPI